MDNLVNNPAFQVECGFSSPNLQSKETSYSKEPPYKCKFCSRRFLHSSKLQIHEKIHTGERPYKCTFCGHGCIQPSNLKKHERIHTGERPFQCKYCGRLFADSSNLQTHLRNLHSLACLSKTQKKEPDTELLQNSGTVNVTSNVADKNMNFHKIRYEGTNIDSQTVFDPSPQPSTSKGFELENRNYVSNDEMYKCRLCSYSFRQENDLNLHYITHFDSI